APEAVTRKAKMLYPIVTAAQRLREVMLRVEANGHDGADVSEAQDAERALTEEVDAYSNHYPIIDDHQHDNGVDAPGDIVRCQTCGVPAALQEPEEKIKIVDAIVK